MTVGYIFWLVLTIIFTIIEFAIPALVTVWFAFAAALTVFVSLITDSMKVEITFFTVVSLLSIIFLRPYARAILSKNKDNFDAEKIDTCIKIKKIVDNSVNALKELGAEIVEVSLPHTKYAVPTYYVLAPAEASSNLARFDGIRYGYRAKDYTDLESLYVKTRTEGFGAEVKRRIMMGTYVLSAGFFDAYFKKAQKVRNLIKQDFENVLAKVDVILTPVAPSVAFKLSDVKTPIELYLEDIFTISANLAGIPAISLPGGLLDNLPVGVQFMGKPFDEGTLIKVSSALENKIGRLNLPKLD